MAARALWKGALRIGDLSCPVSLLTAVSTSERIAFHSVNRKTGNRLNRIFVDEESGEPVDKDDQAKGYVTEGGDTILVGQDEIAAVTPESDKTLRAEQFVALTDVDPLYFDRSYYLAPSDAVAIGAYQAIRAALAESKAAAIAKAVLFRRARTVLVRAEEHGLMATLLSFDYQVRATGEAFDRLPNIKIEKDMLGLAEHIIKTKLGAFDPKSFDDRYENAVAEMIKAKLEGKTVRPKAQPTKAKVVNLMDALRESLKAAGGAAPDASTKARSSKSRAPAAHRITRKAS